MRDKIMPVEETVVEAAFRKGQEQGEVLARLAGHDAKFALINGSMGRTADALTSLTSKTAESLSTLTNAITALTNDTAAKEKVATALLVADERRRKDLEEMDERRRKKNEEEEELKRKATQTVATERAEKTEANWLPMAKIFVVLSVAIQLFHLIWTLRNPT